MSPILVAIDAGHYQREQSCGAKNPMQVKLVCRACGEPMPCPTIKAAREEHLRAMLRQRGAEASA